MKPSEFIAVIAPIAAKLRAEGSPIFPSVRIAQAMLETGCTLHSWNNLVGFKVGSGQPNGFWKGRSVSTKTWEVYDGVRHDGVTAFWRAYDTVEDCFRDQDLLFVWSRYDRVRAAKSPQAQTAMLLACGYATDPRYADKLNSLIAGNGLEQYDRLEDEWNMPMKLAEWQWDMLYEVLGKAYNEDRLAWEWMQKIVDRTMTATELVFINTVLDGRIDRKIEV
ncbi:glucosaminidase domain-containing protein [Paenibacillus filicis]|uniref:Glucosaminidase domain-containing protein n=1 Tax=Paenibacillus filicis TaxID=669464 RepID=A0ABU9DVJ2_9BACL